jgi:hypothetical protein
MAALRSLADTGIMMRGEELGEIGQWSKDWAIASGETRFGVLGEMLVLVDRWWYEHSEMGGASQSALDEVDRLIRSEIGGVLDESDIAHAAQLAQQLHRAVWGSLAPASEWRAAGEAFLTSEGPSVEARKDEA